MTEDVIAQIPRCTPLKTSRNRRGNVLLKYDHDEGTRVLKLYRGRGTLLRDILSNLSHRVLERKTGTLPGSRRATELRHLKSWSRRGFDVFRHFEAPLPEGIEPPALWLEYCPGHTLARTLRDPETPLEEKLDLVTRLASESCPRHGIALAERDIHLVQEHATAKHILVAGDRLITFDFEGGFLPGFSIREALAQELGGTLRSLAKFGGALRDVLHDAFIEGYEDRAMLRTIVAWGVHGGGIYRRVRRWYDRHRRPENTKAGSLERVLAVLA